MEREIKNPYNITNKLIPKEFIEEIFKKYNTNIKIKRMYLFQTAMTHKSYIYKSHFTNEQLQTFKNEISNALDLQKYSYERLEFLGDSILKTIISTYIFKRYKNEMEGFLTNLKIKLEKKSNFAFLSTILNLGQYILLSSSIENNMSRTTNKLLEDVFESFIGALYLDTDYDTTNDFVIKLFETEIDFVDLLIKNDNYKSLLLQYYHKMNWNPPIYKVLTEEGASNNRTFSVGVYDNFHKIIAHGKGRTKQNAEQIASKYALIKFKQII